MSVDSELQNLYSNMANGTKHLLGMLMIVYKNVSGSQL